MRTLSSLSKSTASQSDSLMHRRNVGKFADFCSYDCNGLHAAQSSCANTKIKKDHLIFRSIQKLINRIQPKTVKQRQ